jgi:asparagine synthase (glutamine-hydrolysing)
VSQAGADSWVFASEVRALLASGLVSAELRAAAVDSYLTFGAVTAPWTLLEDVQSLLPGEHWCFDLRTPAGLHSPQRTCYWRPPFSARTGPAPSHAEAVERLRPVLLEAVGLRMVSDVPVGVFLSGGIDSSSVVAALASQGHKLNTFAVVFGESQYDESVYSRQVARQFGTEHTELFLSPAQVLEDFDQALAGYDQPSIDGLNTYFISRATRHAGIKVALSGLGGDELFAGYPYFRLFAHLERRWPRRLARLAYQVLRRVAPRRMRTVKLGAVLHGGGSRLDNYAVCRRVMDRERRAAVFAQPGAAGPDPLPAEIRADLESTAAELDPVNAQSLLELSLYLANMLLRDTDQMSMAHALEVREPLLDHVLVETAAELPGALKLARGRHNGTKALLVDALPTALPARLVRRPKMGFVFPWERWLRNELKERIQALFEESSALEAARLDHHGVLGLWADFLQARPGVRYTDILCLAHLLHWVARHRATVPALCG